MRFIRTWSGAAESHRTLQLLTARRLVHVWFHVFERGWWYADGRMVCFGFGWFSVNAFNIEAH